MYRLVELTGSLGLLQVFFPVQRVKQLLIVFERSQVERIPRS
ncbi:hypothetical protein [Paenibacillus typhae]